MKQYRKKPVTIEAVQFDGLNPTEIKDFVGENCEVEIYDNRVTPPVARIVIHTLEGDMEVSKGDYVIRGVKGEFYPCKPDIFEKTYESAEPDKSMEEAAEKHINEALFKWSYDDEDGIEQYVHDSFIAGAEWQARQLLQGSPMPEDTVLFNKGVKEGRRLEREDMLKDAVEGEAEELYNDGESQCVVSVGTYFEPGEKVYVLKAEEE